MIKVLWVAAAVLLVLCVRINANRTTDNVKECIDPDMKAFHDEFGGCSADRSWSVSLKLPWHQW